MGSSSKRHYVEMTENRSRNTQEISEEAVEMMVWEINTAKGFVASFQTLLGAHSFILSLLATVNLIAFLQPPKGWNESQVDDSASHLNAMSVMYNTGSIEAYAIASSLSLYSAISGLLFYLYCSQAGVTSLEDAEVPKESKTDKKESETGKQETETGKKDSETEEKKTETGKKGSETDKKGSETGKKGSETEEKKERETEEKKGSETDEKKGSGTEEKKGSETDQKKGSETAKIQALQKKIEILHRTRTYLRRMVLPGIRRSSRILSWFLAASLTFSLIAFISSGYAATSPDERLHYVVIPGIPGCILVLVCFVLALLKHEHDLDFETQFDNFWLYVVPVEMEIPGIRPPNEAALTDLDPSVFAFLKPWFCPRMASKTQQHISLTNQKLEDPLQLHLHPHAPYRL